MSLAGSSASTRPRVYVGAQDDVGSTSSRASARPRVFLRRDDDSSSVGSYKSARPRAFVRKEEDGGSTDSYASAARPRVYVGDDGTTGSVSSHTSIRPKAFLRGDDDTGSVSSRASARPKAFIRADDDAGSVSSHVSARPKAYIRRDGDSSSMSSNQGLNRSRIDSGHSSVRPHVGIAGGGGLTAAMLQQHRATTGTGIGGLDLGASRARYDLDETRSMTGMSARIRRPLGSIGRAPLAQSLSASVGPRIRVPVSEIPPDAPSHGLDDVKKSLETQFAARNAAMDKKVADLRTDFAGITTQLASLNSQVAELRDAVLVPGTAPLGVGSGPAAMARLEEHNADLLSRQASLDREVAELNHRVKFLSSATTKISTLEDSMEAFLATRQNQEQPVDHLADQVQLMQRRMDSCVDMAAVENLLSVRLSRELREMEDRMSANLSRMEQRVQDLEQQSCLQRQDSLMTLRNDLSDDIQRLQSSMLRKSDLLPMHNAQMQRMEEVAQLSSALDRHERKLQDSKAASASLRDELVDTRNELTKTLQNQQRSAAVMMEETLEQIATRSKEKAIKVDDQLSELAQKQKILEETVEMLQQKMALVKVEASRRISLDRKEEDEKLRQCLARSIAEMEALATAKVEVERRHVLEQQHFHSRLDDLRVSLSETEKQKELQRLELLQRLQEESELMGVAQGQNSLLEKLLACGRTEKSEYVRRSKKKMAKVRGQIRSLESAKATEMRRLTSQLQAKQNQVKLLTQTLGRVETATAKMLALSKREAQSVRRAKATKEHELYIAQLKLKEMERVAQKGDRIKAQAVLTAATTMERNELERLLLESLREKEELKQELEEMTEALNATKESQKIIMEETIPKLSSDYVKKVGELKLLIADREQTTQHLRDLVETSDLSALVDELTALKNEGDHLLTLIQHAQSEHERIAQETETSVRLEYATELIALKSKFGERVLDLGDANFELEATKTSITESEKELKSAEVLYQRDVSALTHKIEDARGKIDECTAQIVKLVEVKACLEEEISQIEANLNSLSTEKEELATNKNQMLLEIETLRAKLAEVSSSLEEKQVMVMEARKSDEANRERLVGLAMSQEELQIRFVSQIDSLTLKLHQERESSRTREQDLDERIARLTNDVDALKSDSSKESNAACAQLMSQMSDLVTALQASQRRENHLKSRLEHILEALVQHTNASNANVLTTDADDNAIAHNLISLYATHHGSAHELDRLQLEYELTAKEAAVDSATAQELANWVKCHQLQINSLESVVEQLREQLKEQYHKDAIMAKRSNELESKMAAVHKETQQLEREFQAFLETDQVKRDIGTSPPKSQRSAVDGTAMALALHKAQADYFSESSETGLDDMEGEQPDVELESVT